MPFTAADTIRILVATDNHVGYNERDPIRGDDSWKSFHEVMCLAKEHDVDMVLLAGDLFHENKPSQKSMYQVMRSLRMNCYGEKPCELEMLSDGSEAFAGTFNHVNYEDPDVNVAIPVFTIHGNHDDPSGSSHLTPLDLLQMSGLINYYGRTPESDNILIKPLLLQKGQTKLALYGMSNVRDERLFRTFRDGNVKFFQPGTQKDDWFNLMSVHQNRHAHTETGYLPVHFLPEFLDLVVWGHEHECKIDPEHEPESDFHVMQPGSSVATSLIDSESQEKHVAILTIQGKNFKTENIRLKTVRPFIYRDIALKDDKRMKDIAFDDDNMPKVHAYLVDTINKLIDEANEDWLQRQQEAGAEVGEDTIPPLPLIRVRVDYSAPEGGKYEMENPQRFSNRFTGRVANIGDVVSYHRKRTAATRNKNEADMPEEEVFAQLSIENIKIGKLVEEFLAAQSLTILPQNSFVDKVGQFVDKDDKEAIREFIEQSLGIQVNSLLAGEGDDDADEDITKLMQAIKEREEGKFERGELKTTARKGKFRPPPPNWDSDFDGHWEDQYAAIIREGDEGVNDDDLEEEEEEEDGTPAPRASASRGGRGGRGRGRGGKAATTSTRKTAATTKKAPAKSTATRGRKKQISDDEDDDDNDVIMLDDDDDDEVSQGLFVSQSTTSTARASKTTAASRAKKTPAASKTPARGSKATPAASGRQSKLTFGSSQATNASGPASRAGGRAAAPQRLREPSDDEISDDDAFEPPSTAARAGTRRR